MNKCDKKEYFYLAIERVEIAMKKKRGEYRFEATFCDPSLRPTVVERLVDSKFWIDSISISPFSLPFFFRALHFVNYFCYTRYSLIVNNSQVIC